MPQELDVLAGQLDGGFRHVHRPGFCPPAPDLFRDGLQGPGDPLVVRPNRDVLPPVEVVVVGNGVVQEDDPLVEDVPVDGEMLGDGLDLGVAGDGVNLVLVLRGDREGVADLEALLDSLLEGENGRLGDAEGASRRR
jgi:hypothetical protein